MPDILDGALDRLQIAPGALPRSALLSNDSAYKGHRDNALLISWAIPLAI